MCVWAVSALCGLVHSRAAVQLRRRVPIGHYAFMQTHSHMGSRATCLPSERLTRLVAVTLQPPIQLDPLPRFLAAGR